MCCSYGCHAEHIATNAKGTGGTHWQHCAGDRKSWCPLVAKAVVGANGKLVAGGIGLRNGIGSGVGYAEELLHAFGECADVVAGRYGIDGVALHTSHCVPRECIAADGYACGCARVGGLLPGHGRGKCRQGIDGAAKIGAKLHFGVNGIADAFLDAIEKLGGIEYGAWRAVERVGSVGLNLVDKLVVGGAVWPACLVDVGIGGLAASEGCACAAGCE